MTDAEVAYLRGQVDKLGADNFALRARVVGFRRELEVRRRGFALLARLGGAVGAHTQFEPALAAALPAIERELQVQRSLALRCEGGRWVPFAWTGFPSPEAQQLAGAAIELPDRLAAGEVVVVNADTPEDPWVVEVRRTLGVEKFACAPVAGGTHALMAARLAEQSIFYPRFEEADAVALGAVGDLISSGVENARLAVLSEARRFLPPAIVKQLESGAMAPDAGHERRDVTLLAVDMVGSTALAERMDPEHFADLLNAYLRETTSLAHAHEGTVGSLAGDGLMVIFGAPEAAAPERQAWSAAQAAFAIRARIAAVAEAAGHPEGAVTVRVGINSGSSSVGVYGSDTQRTYTAMGLPVHLAARLQGIAEPGEIIASEATVALLEDRVSSRERERVALKGFGEPVAAYAIEPR